MARPGYILRLLTRAAVAAAWLACVAWWGAMAASHGYSAVMSSYDAATTPRGPWVEVEGTVESLKRESSRKWGLEKTRDVIYVSYHVDGQWYRTEFDFVAWSSDRAVSTAEEIREKIAGRKVRGGSPLPVWVTPGLPDVPRLSKPPAPLPPWPDLGWAIAYGAGILLATAIARKIVSRPLPGGPGAVALPVDAGSRKPLGEATALQIPEPEDVPLPRSIEIEPIPFGIRIGFPRQERDSRDVFGWIAGGLFGVTFIAVGLLPGAGGGGWAFVAFGVVCVFFFLLELRQAYRRCAVEVTRKGLVSRKGYGGLATRTVVARQEIDFLETRPNVATGHPGASTTYFEIAAIRANGERMVLGENVPGLAVADTLVRRVGRELGLHPEQILNAAATVRRALASFHGAFPLEGRVE